MKEITFTVTDPLGIHARPAGILVKEAKKYASKITVWKGDKSCDMRKLLALMGMAVKQGGRLRCSNREIPERELLILLNLRVWLFGNPSSRSLF